ncbi:unnamed protein product, partial [Effrenium voratum]
SRLLVETSILEAGGNMLRAVWSCAIFNVSYALEMRPHHNGVLEEQWARCKKGGLAFEAATYFKTEKDLNEKLQQYFPFTHMSSPAAQLQSRRAKLVQHGILLQMKYHGKKRVSHLHTYTRSKSYTCWLFWTCSRDKTEHSHCTGAVVATFQVSLHLHFQQLPLHGTWTTDTIHSYLQRDSHFNTDCYEHLEGSKRETASEMAKDVQLNLQAQWRQEHVMTGGLMAVRPTAAGGEETSMLLKFSKPEVSPGIGVGGFVHGCFPGSKPRATAKASSPCRLETSRWTTGLRNAPFGLGHGDVLRFSFRGRVSFTLSGQESYELQIEERYNYVPSAVAACIPPGVPFLRKATYTSLVGIGDQLHWKQCKDCSSGEPFWLSVNGSQLFLGAGSQVGKNLLRKVRLENRRVDVHPSHDEVHWTLTSKVCRQGLPTGSKHGMGVVRISTALLEAMLSERSTVLTNFLAQSSNVVADAQLSYSSHLRGASLAVVGDGSRSLQLSMASGSLNASCSSHSSTQPRVLFAGSLRGIKAHNVTSLAWRQHGALHIAPALPPDGGGLKIESVSVERPGVPISQRALQTYTTELFTKFLPDINEELGKFAFVLPRSLAQFVRCKSAEQSGQPVCGNFALRQLKGMQGYLEFTDFESDPVMLASRKDPFTGSFKVALLGLAILAWHLLAEGFGKAWLLSFMSFALLLLLFAAWGPGGPGMWSWHGPFADFSVANFQHFGLQRPESVVSKLQDWADFATRVTQLEVVAVPLVILCTRYWGT